MINFEKFNPFLNQSCNFTRFPPSGTEISHSLSWWFIDTSAELETSLHDNNSCNKGEALWGVQLMWNVTHRYKQKCSIQKHSSVCMSSWNIWKQELEGHSEERIPPPHNASSTRTYRAQYILEISCDTALYRFGPSLDGEESLWKLNNSCIQIRFRIFTNIESICPRHTPNLSTTFHPNPSTTFWDIMLYIVLPLSLNGEESLKKINNSRIQIRIWIFSKNRA